MSDRSSLSRTTVSGAFYTIGKTVISLLPYSLLVVILARIFPTVQELGLVQSLISLIVISVIFASLGLNIGGLRLISFYSGKGKDELARQASLFIFLTSILSSIFIAAVLFYSSGFIAYTLLHDMGFDYLIRLVSIASFLASLVNICSYLLYSQYQFKFVARISMLNSSLRFVIPLVFIIIGLGVEAVMLGFMIADAISVILLCIVLVPEFGRQLPSIGYIKSIFSYSIPLYAVNVLRYVSLNIDYYLLLYLSDLYVAGIYTPALLVANALTAILIAAGDTMLPYSSRLYGSSGMESVRNVLHFVSRYIFLLFIPIGFLVSFNLDPLITVFMGHEYSASIFPMVIVSFAITITALGPIFDSILTSTGMGRVVLASFSLALPSQIVVSGIVIPIFGALGASLSRSLALGIRLLYSAYRLKKMNILSYDKRAMVVGLVGSSVMVSVVFVLTEYVAGVLFMPVNLVVGIMVYLFILKYSKVVTEQDVNVIMNFSPVATRRVLLLVLKGIRR